MGFKHTSVQKGHSVVLPLITAGSYKILNHKYLMAPEFGEPLATHLLASISNIFHINIEAVIDICDYTRHTSKSG